MRKVVIVLIFSTYVFAAFSQGTNVYSFFVNFVNEDFKFPLIGFVNTAKGNHKGLQLGFVNTNTGNFSGLQAGFVNTIGGDLNNVQLSFLNTVTGDAKGLQAGFVNTTTGNLSATQLGFVNTAIKEAHGAQLGFINTTIQGIDGLQLGFVNIARQKLKGVQLGFVNYTDNIEKGIPIGFLSFVRHGGYQAIEYSFSEFHPVTVGFKTGVEQFYTTLFLAYNPSDDFTRNRFAAGLGIGSIIPIKNAFFFNPELNSLTPLAKNNDRQLTSFIPFFGYNFNNHFSITAGPSVTWNYNYDNGDLLKPVFKIANFEINDNHRIVIGARVGIRYRF